MSKLPEDLRKIVQAMLGEESHVELWKRMFGKVLAQVSWKDRFTQQVLPLIDQGIREVGIWSQVCRMCEDDGFAIPNPLCDHCVVGEPCLNCYWYDTDPMQTSVSLCRCSSTVMDISYQAIHESFTQVMPWPTYAEFIKSEEYTMYLETEEQMRMQMDEHARNRQAAADAQADEAERA